ncbi:MAG: DUF1353 domain-containing protein [Brevirhabdus sp.]
MTPIPAVFAVVTLSACTTLAPSSKTNLQDAGTYALMENPCARASSPICLFVNSPVTLDNQPLKVPTRKATFFHTTQALEFIDNQSRNWTAPPRTLTDGASIPKVFIPVIGDPRSKEFLNAATLHDAYCGIGNEELPTFHARRWQEVHRMFYDTLIVGGTPEIKAKVMFAAVYLGGPRWDESYRTMTNIPPSTMQAGMVKAKAFIEKENPDLNRLQVYLDWLEDGMRGRVSGAREDRDDREHGAYDPSDPSTGPLVPYDPGTDPSLPTSPSTP